jgi:hypothetical protein
MSNVFWPYSRRAAVVSAVSVWIAAAIALGITNAAVGWPNSATRGWLPLLVVAIGLVPPALVLLDGFRTSRARIDLPWFKVDFSATVVTAALIRETAGIPENIISPGEQIYDSGGAKIEAALDTARENRILVIDLHDGDAWWVTRLLVLAAGAVRSHTTEAIVFVGTREETEGRVFLGWATPQAVLQAARRARPEYEAIAARAERIERQVDVFGALPAGIALDPRLPEFAGLGTPKPETILMRLMAGDPEARFEQPPDRLTEARLTELLAASIHRRDTIDADATGDEQLRALLAGETAFVAVVRNGRFEGLLRRSEGERMILKRLFEQRDGAAAANGGVPPRAA